MAIRADATVRVGVQEKYTRLAFSFAGPTTVTPLLQGNRLDLRFSRAADIDIADCARTPPRSMCARCAVSSAAGAPVRLVLTLDSGVRQRHFVDGNRVVLDLLTPETPAWQSTAPMATRAPAPAAQRGASAGERHGPGALGGRGQRHARHRDVASASARGGVPPRRGDLAGL
jgi:hypothetical protein